MTRIPTTSSTPKPSWRLLPLPLRDVRLTGGFWQERQETNRTRTIPHIEEQCRLTGRLGALTLSWKPGQKPEPHIFWDSDVAKWIEAACYSLATHPDPELGRRVDAVVELLERAQQPDGYLNNHFVAVEPDKRWTNLRDKHELYCAGHLIEAAVAHAEATGSPRFLDVMRRFVEHIDGTFGSEPGKKRGYPGHEEIELALVKLARHTGERRYLRLAEYFVLERGSKPNYFEVEARARGEEPQSRWSGEPYSYHQAHRPVVEQRTAEGHAVRAMYLYSAMADLAAETANADLRTACRALWKNVTERQMYLTGGVGSSAQGERFTADYDLPNESAYAETCAAIGLVLWAHRMTCLEADATYADVMERALYNGVLPGLSLDGTGFFYVNRLASHPTAVPDGRWERQPWFGCACCPPNVARLLASLGGYIYGRNDRELAVHLYASSEASLVMDGVPLTVSQSTDYPWTGDIRITLAPERPVRCALLLRLPSWCARPTLTVCGERVDPESVLRRGYLTIRRTWRAGDHVALDLAMPPRRSWSHPAIRANGGRVALERGPLVYCLEETDNGRDLGALILPRSARLRAARASWLPGGVAIEALGRREEAGRWGTTPYRGSPASRTQARIRAIPYYAWCNRKAGEMTVWIRE